MEWMATKSNIIVLILLVTLFALWSNNQNVFAQSNDGFLLYQNINDGISIEYPSNWNVYNYMAGSFGPPNQDDKTSVTLHIYSPGQVSFFPYSNSSLDEIVNLRLDDEHELNSPAIVDVDFNLLNKEESTLSNYSSYEILYSIREYLIFGDYLKILGVWTKIGNKVYVVEYKSDLQSYNDYLPVVNRMIESIEITPSVISPESTSSMYIVYLSDFYFFS